MSDRQLDSTGAVLKAILAAVEARRIFLYRSPTNKPHIRVPLKGMDDEHYHILDKEVEYWLANFVWDMGVLLRPSELEQIIKVLAGRAMANPSTKISDPTLLKILETEPVVVVVAEYMLLHSPGHYEHRTEDLWKLLHDFAKKRDLLRIGKKKFPGGSNVLSRQLKLFASVFKLLGIVIEVKRANGSWTTIIRLDDSHTESSSPNFNPDNDLPHEDDRKQRLANLQALKESSALQQSEGETNR